MHKTSTSSFPAVAVAPDASKARPSRLAIEKIRQFARAYMSTPIGGIILN